MATVFEVRDELWQVVELMIRRFRCPPARAAGRCPEWGPDPIDALAGER